MLCNRTHVFAVKKMGKVPKVTLYAYLFKPNPPNGEKHVSVTQHIRVINNFWKALRQSEALKHVFHKREGATILGTSFF